MELLVTHERIMGGKIQALKDLVPHLEYITESKVGGALVECGTWRGGCLAFMAKAMELLGDSRFAWAFDSFEGMPKPGSNDGRTEHEWWYPGWCTATVDEFWDTIELIGLDRERVRAVKGWFEESFKKVGNDEVGPIALLRLDADWYESQMACLRKWWPNVSLGGLVVSDDYHVWKGDRLAFDEFLATLPQNSFEFYLPRPPARFAFVRKLQNNS